MDPETKELLKENLEISKANNQLLTKLLRSQKRANISRYIYWGIILFFTFGAYFFIQPFLNSIFNAYGVSNVNNYSDIGKNFNDNKQQIQDLFNSLK